MGGGLEEAARPGVGGERGERRFPFGELLGEERGVGPGGQGHDLEPVAMPAQHAQRALADRAGRAEDGDALHRSDHPERAEEESGDGEHEVERVEPVEDPAVARDQPARILDAGLPLEE